MSARATARVERVATVAVLVLSAVACSRPAEPFERIDAPIASDVEEATSGAADQTATEQTATERACIDGDLATASFAPGDLDAAAPSVEEIRGRGRLRVGVDEATLGFAARDPDTNEIEGFEVDLAHQLASRILGADYRPDMVELVPLATDEKTPFVRDGKVDLTISAVTMGCSRWEEVAFSAEYFTAHQEFLVRTDSELRDADDLDDVVVCATQGSSSVKIMQRLRPDVTLLEVDTRIECLVALQQGDADAYFGHDSFLYGMLLQDPTVEVRRGIFDPADTVSHYGIAISHDRVDLVRSVNAALEAIAADGTWEVLHQRLEESIGIPPAHPPTPRYRD